MIKRKVSNCNAIVGASRWVALVLSKKRGEDEGDNTHELDEDVD